MEVSRRVTRWEGRSVGAPGSKRWFPKAQPLGRYRLRSVGPSRRSRRAADHQTWAFDGRPGWWGLAGRVRARPAPPGHTGPRRKGPPGKGRACPTSLVTPAPAGVTPAMSALRHHRGVNPSEHSHPRPQGVKAAENLPPLDPGVKAVKDLSHLGTAGTEHPHRAWLGSPGPVARASAPSSLHPPWGRGGKMPAAFTPCGAGGRSWLGLPRLWLVLQARSGATGGFAGGPFLRGPVWPGGAGLGRGRPRAHPPRKPPPQSM
ncbi:hypothetical protein SUDANB121_04976 [Nocardiopsis dassonvillei]